MPPVRDSATATLAPRSPSRRGTSAAPPLSGAPPSSPPPRGAPFFPPPPAALPQFGRLPAGPFHRGTLAGPAQPHRPRDIVGAGDDSDDNGRSHQPEPHRRRPAGQRQDVEADRDVLQQRLRLAAAAGR